MTMNDETVLAASTLVESGNAESSNIVVPSSLVLTKTNNNIRNIGAGRHKKRRRHEANPTNSTISTLNNNCNGSSLNTVNNDSPTSSPYTSTSSSGSSSSSSDGEEDECFPTSPVRLLPLSTKLNPKNEEEDNLNQQPPGWRVKLYRLNLDGSWDDCGTGRIAFMMDTNSAGIVKAGQCDESNKAGKEDQPDAGPSATLEESIYQEVGAPALCMQAEVASSEPSLTSSPTTSPQQPKPLLQAPVLLREAYQRQGDNIITWCEPCFQNDNGGVDLALSFQDNAGCLDIWSQVSDIQTKAAEILQHRQEEQHQPSVDRTTAIAILHQQHHQHVHQQHQQNDSKQQQQDHQSFVDEIAEEDHGLSDVTISQEQHQQQHAEAVAHLQYHQQQQQQQQHNMWTNVAFSSDEDGQFTGSGGSHHSDQTDHETSFENSPLGSSSITLPVPTLRNLDEITDLIAGNAAAVATVTQMEQREFLALFFSKNDCSYLLSLLSLFSIAEKQNDFANLANLAICSKQILLLNDPTLVEFIVTDCDAFEHICGVLEYDPDLRVKADHRWFLREQIKFRTVVLMEDEELMEAIHRGYRVLFLRDTLLRPTMDEGSLSTLASLLQFTHAEVVKGVTLKNDSSQDSTSYLVKVLCMLQTEIRAIHDIIECKSAMPIISSIPPTTQEQEGNNQTNPNNIWKQHLLPQDSSLSSRKMRRKGCLAFLRELFNMVRTSLQQSAKEEFFKFCQIDSSTSLLSLLSAILFDPTSDVSERSACLEILSTIVMHDTNIIRKHCLEFFAYKTSTFSKNNNPNKQLLIYRPEPNDKKQVVFFQDEDDLLLSLLYTMAVETDAGLLLQTSEIMRIILDNHLENTLDNHSVSLFTNCDTDDENTITNITNKSSSASDRNSFLEIFYDHYISWVVAPFQYAILIPSLTHPVPPCAIRSSFAVELLCFCVRAHLYQMKLFVLRNRVLGSVLKLLTVDLSNEDRCLKLAVLRFLRSILFVKDEFYHRHIVQNNLFAPVFDAFRANPIGDNLVSSAIIEMMDFIRIENIKSLLDHIVTKYLMSPPTSTMLPTLEDFSTPYVVTLTLMRKKYEENRLQQSENSLNNTNANSLLDSVLSARGVRIMTNPKALEDQRKFRETDEEESYFNTDDDEDEPEQHHHMQDILSQTELPDPINTETDVSKKDYTTSTTLASILQQYSSSSDDEEDEVIDSSSTLLVGHTENLNVSHGIQTINREPKDEIIKAENIDDAQDNIGTNVTNENVGEAINLNQQKQLDAIVCISAPKSDASPGDER